MNPSIDEIVAMYGEGENHPSRTQWKTLLEGDLHRPLTVVNFFQLRERADRGLIQESLSGEEAFSKYAETSVPKVAEVGGHFVLRGAFSGDFIGQNLDSWHIIAIGQYSKRADFIALLMDQDYRQAFKYRQAAVAKQHVYFVDAM